MLEDTLVADLIADLPAAVRLQRLVNTMRTHFGCSAVALLQLQQLQQEQLKPIAVCGLVAESLGRRFAVAHHPRLAAILQSRQPVHFAPDCDLADPYDGLVETQQAQPLLVHDCMGISLYLEGQCYGVLTLDALQAGTFSRLTLLELQRFTLLVEASLRVCQLETELRSMRFARANAPLDSGVQSVATDEIIGQHRQLLQLLAEVKVVANSDLPVLLLGETGVGKELFARYLHRESNRALKPMIYINCAALPESLAESELFGHVKGAFSGALQERSGRFEAADGGTLFLDEVGELPILVQAKLLRVLQNGEIQRLGSDKSRRVNVRIVAATNRNLAQQVALGAFRADLYHRLSVYPVLVPPLRERSSDISMLAGHFLEQNRCRLGLRSIRLSELAQMQLLHYHWPGNIRELEHVLSRAAIKALSEGHHRNDILTIEPRWLDISSSPVIDGSPLQVGGALVGGTLVSADGRAAPNTTASLLPMKQALAQFQCRQIEAAFLQSGGSWSVTAKILGLDSSNLHKLAEIIRHQGAVNRIGMMLFFRMVCYRALALSSLLLAIIGMVIPGLPTVPFILLAAFAAGRGWPALEQYLLGHPTFGPSIKLWRQAGVVPRPAKYGASVMMLASLCLLWFGALALMFKALVTVVVAVTGLWLWRRPEYSTVKES